MIDLVTLHVDQKTDNLELMIFHDVKVTGYEICAADNEFTIYYTHTQDENNCKRGEPDYETYIFPGSDKEGEYTGICVNEKWYPIGKSGLIDYISVVRILLENEITENNLKDVAK